MLSADIKCIDWNVKMPLLALPTRTVLVRTKQGVVVLSPPPSHVNAGATMSSFGEVSDVISPNLFHNIGAKNALKEHPEATHWGVAGFDQKLPDLAFTKTLLPEHWGNDELELFPILGMPKFNEVAVLHKASRTLICSDLCFNYVDGKGAGYYLVFNMFGTYRRFAVSKMFMRMAKDKQALTRSVQQLLAADFDNIIMSHGEMVFGDGREKLAAAFHERGIK